MQSDIVAGLGAKLEDSPAAISRNARPEIIAAVSGRTVEVAVRSLGQCPGIPSAAASIVGTEVVTYALGPASFAGSQFKNHTAAVGAACRRSSVKIAGVIEDDAGSRRPSIVAS